MATNKNASIRYRALDKCFRDFRQRYFIEDLIDKCEEELESFNFTANVSRRQIFDDIRFMESEAGWSIPLERIKDGRKPYYRYSDPNFTINEQPLTDEEAQQFKTMIITLSRFRGLPSNAWVEELISNLEWRFNLKGKNENIVSFEQNQNLKGIDKLGEILDATSNHQVLKLLYHNYKNGGRDLSFILHPYHVKQYNNRWFLFGLNDEYKTISTIALDRIVKMEIVENISFITNEHVDFEHYFDDVVGVSIPKDDIAKEHIVLKFSKDRFPYITSKPIHHSQKIESEDECIISIEVRPNRELDAQILSYGSDVEVLESAAYREHISKIIEENFKKYFAAQNDCTQES
jgi:predicted DNA-binding transcriptional regulator YafY